MLLLLDIFKAQKFGMGFLRINFWARGFWGVLSEPLGIFWVLIFAPIQSSTSLEIGVPQRGLGSVRI